MPAKIANDNAFIQDERGALGFFASKLAPTMGGSCRRGGKPGQNVYFKYQPHGSSLTYSVTCLTSR
ncbi:hypothetical protein PsexTeo8_24320 [Pseudomonas extremaustralis]|nr:hypothetical protein [Pseudomonas extremaustralis]